MIHRKLEGSIAESLKNSPRIVILYGPRQVGKTTLMRKIIPELGYKTLEINADQIKYRDVLSSRDLDQLRGLVTNYELLFIDEAQNVPDIGMNLKILHDHIPNLKIAVTGSSALELANLTKESLTGRTRTFKLYPISVEELATQWNTFQINSKLEELMLFGSYPEVIKLENRKEKIELLEEICSSYLYKDVLQLSGIRHSSKIHKLLSLLALQCGSLVSIQEIGKSLGLSHDTVNSYIDLLEKGFILYRLSGYSRNLRKEVNKMNKIYFYDNGIRNALTHSFNPLELRQDTGSLWENFLISERIKSKEYNRIHGQHYFWRSYSGAELDYVEESDGQLSGFEIKWRKTKARPIASWLQSYENSSFKLINRENFLEFIS